MGDEEVEYKAEYLDTAEDAEPEVGVHFATRYTPGVGLFLFINNRQSFRRVCVPFCCAFICPTNFATTTRHIHIIMYVQPRT